MRGDPYHYYQQGDHHKSSTSYPSEHQYPYQQMGGLRRLETGAIRTHFYPEGGWGWIVCACAFLAHVTTSGAQLSAGALHIVLANKFQDSTAHHWLGPLSWSVSSVFSPLVVNLCRRKNVRILALIGGILFPLSLLFTSLATELHQIFFSFGVIGGIGSCMVRESSGVVLGEFFRKRRQFVEQVVMAGTGVGVTLFSLLYLSFTRHLEWGVGFKIGAAFTTICVLLPAFYRNAAKYQPRDRTGDPSTKHQRVESPKSPSSMVVPIGGDICRSLQLFCVPSLKPLLWSSAISSFGLYAPVFLMSDFGRKENLSGGSLLLLQTHLGLGLSLGVILGAILTLKKFKFCQLSPRFLCICTGCLTGLSMIAISSVKGYYGYSLSAWLYGVALGSHLYTLKVLTMELTRTKHWSRIWSCIQSLMSPGILLGTGLTSYAGKPGFYACATAVLIGAGLLGFQLIDMNNCSSPQPSSSLDNDSPIPPAPPPISITKYAPSLPTAAQLRVPSPGLYPLRRSISLQQPGLYPCCNEFGFGGYPPGYSPYCRECVMGASPTSWAMYYHPTANGAMIRSYSLPQTTGPFKSTGTQTNPNSPVRGGEGGRDHPHHHHPSNQISLYPGSYDRLPTLPGSFLPQDRVIREHPGGKEAGISPYPFKNTVMFASNPQLFPVSTTQSSASTTDRSLSITPMREERRANFAKSHQKQTQAPRYYPAAGSTIASVENYKKVGENAEKVERQQPAFTRHYFDSSKIQKGSVPKNIFPTIHQPTNNTNNPQHLNNIPKASKSVQSRSSMCNSATATATATTSSKWYNPNATISTKPTLPITDKVLRGGGGYDGKGRGFGDEFDWRSIQRQSNAFENDPDPPYYPAATRAAPKVSGHEFDVEQPKFNSLRRSLSRSGVDSSVSSQLNYPHIIPTTHQHQHQYFNYTQDESANYQNYTQQLQHHQRSNHGGEPPRNLSKGRTGDCPYCDERRGPPPPLSLSVPTLGQNDPHYMCHYGGPPPPPPTLPPSLKRRNTWHHRDQLEAITTSV